MPEVPQPEPRKARVDYGPDVTSAPKKEEGLSNTDAGAILDSMQNTLGQMDEKIQAVNQLLDDWVAAGELTKEQAEAVYNYFVETEVKVRDIADTIINVLNRISETEEQRAQLSDEQQDKLRQVLETAKTIGTEQPTRQAATPQATTPGQMQMPLLEDGAKKAGTALGALATGTVNKLIDGLGKVVNFISGAGKLAFMGSLMGVVEKFIEIQGRLDKLAGSIQASQMGVMSTGGIMGRQEARELGGYLEGMTASTAGAVTPERFMGIAGRMMEAGIANSIKEIQGQTTLTGGPTEERNAQLGLFRTTFALSGMLQTSQEDIVGMMEQMKVYGVATGDMADELTNLYNNAQDLGVSFKELRGWTFEAARQLRPLGFRFEEAEALVGHFAGMLQKGTVSVGEITGFFTSFFQKSNLGGMAAIGQRILGAEATTPEMAAVQTQLQGARDAFALSARVRQIGTSETSTAADKQVIYEQIKAQAEEFARGQGYEEGTAEFTQAMDTVAESYGVSTAKLLEGSKAFWDAVDDMATPTDLMQTAAKGMNEAAKKLNTDYEDFYTRQINAIQDSQTIQEKIHRISEWGFTQLWLGFQQLLAYFNVGAFAGREDQLYDIASQMAAGFMSGLGDTRVLDWDQMMMAQGLQQTLLGLRVGGLTPAEEAMLTGGAITPEQLVKVKGGQEAGQYEKELTRLTTRSDLLTGALEPIIRGLVEEIARQTGLTGRDLYQKVYLEIKDDARYVEVADANTIERIMEG